MRGDVLNKEQGRATKASGVRLALLPILILSVGMGVGCVASKEELRGVQSDVQNSVGTARKELKAEIDAAKKQAQDDQQKLKAEIDAKAIKALSDQKEKIDAMAAEMKTQDEAQTKEIQQLKQQLQAEQETMMKTAAGLKVVQDQLVEVQKTNLQMLREFQAVRNGVQVTYGGVLDYLKVEEALLKSSLHRVQTILHGVDKVEPGTLPTIIDPKQGVGATAPSASPKTAQ